MASEGQQPASKPQPQPASNIPKGKREVKILMVHGYMQSASIFSAKTKALHKILTQTLPTLHFNLIFPSGPHRLRYSDIPDYTPPEGVEEEDLDKWAWYRANDATGEYRGLEAGMQTIASTIRDAGGVDGVMGFSQGGCMAALIAGAMEEPRHEPPDQQHRAWMDELRAANNGRPLKFCVVYSGFRARPEAGLDWLYEPRIVTPNIHFIGALEEERIEVGSQRLIDVSKDPSVHRHPGGHFVPCSRMWVMQLAAFLKVHCEESTAKEAL
ncbi:hypothetical protein GGS20DRAFT_579558 [Poronia punctata]|nr:hypothetical protein GGS20DRAFT_579558 [Poronia punctata]